jgi:hypothetical protein
MASESKHEQIAEALRTAFASIGGAGYWHTPDKVLRVSFWPDEMTLDRGYNVTYLLRPGDESYVEEGTSGWGGLEAEFFLIVAKQHNVGTENPLLETAPTRWTVANRLIHDALKKLLEDVELGGLVRNVVLGSLTIDRDRHLPNWALAELRFVVSYSIEGDEP